LGTPKNCNNPLKLWGQSYKRGFWFFVRFFEAVNHWGKWICVVFLFLCFVKWSDNVKNIGLCDLCGLGCGIYITVCKQELEFLWMSNVVLGLCGVKILKR
jgi:hypothetical protein